MTLAPTPSGILGSMATETIERRLARLEDGFRRLKSAVPGVTLRDVLRGFPGGIPVLAEDIGRHKDTLYDYCRGQNRRAEYPTALGADVAKAFREAKTRPYQVKVTQQWLRDAWHGVPLEDDE